MHQAFSGVPQEDVPMHRILKLSSVAMLALGLAGCGHKTEEKVDAAANTAGDAMAAAGDATANAVSDVKDAVTPTPTGQEFVDKAAKSDAFEIAAAKLAKTNAASDDVKSFAAEMVKAHTASTAKVKAAAGKAMPAITPDATLTNDQSDKLADLGKLKGTDFDKKYASGQVDAHEDALSLMQGYAKDGEVQSLKDAAGAIAPTVAKHLDMAKALNK
jgi:putative membrane protein